MTATEGKAMEDRSEVLKRHEEAILAAVEAAEADGLKVRIKTLSCNCCNEGVWISDIAAGEHRELYIY